MCLVVCFAAAAAIVLLVTSIAGAVLRTVQLSDHFGQQVQLVGSV